tara:strand:+ start:265 stop:567 length:303 start_codon:yes stop_codon:yes gene_type:complete
MNIQEQNYSNYLFTIGDPATVAMSWVNVIQAAPTTPEEVDYYNFWFPLSPFDKEESEYLIFSDLFERIAPNQHAAYDLEFEIIGYSLGGLCQRKKAPTPH